MKSYNETRSKSTKSNLRTAHKSRVRVRGISDSEKQIKNKQKKSKKL